MVVKRTILILAAMTGFVQPAVTAEKLESKSVAQTLRVLHLDLNDADMIDEPPGKLRMLEFQEKNNVIIQIVLEYKPETLFSSGRNWERRNILKATVLEVRKAIKVRKLGDDNKVDALAKKTGR